jgi:hypothetical protein
MDSTTLRHDGNGGKESAQKTITMSKDDVLATSQHINLLMLAYSDAIARLSLYSTTINTVFLLYFRPLFWLLFIKLGIMVAVVDILFFFTQILLRVKNKRLLGKSLYGAILSPFNEAYNK